MGRRPRGRPRGLQAKRLGDGVVSERALQEIGPDPGPVYTRISMAFCHFSTFVDVWMLSASIQEWEFGPEDIQMNRSNPLNYRVPRTDFASAGAVREGQ